MEKSVISKSAISNYLEAATAKAILVAIPITTIIQVDKITVKMAPVTMMNPAIKT
ncbi:hypothetical protein [Microbulbifer sp. THAF38]|uniref:hypothetical protein n=1 Tax=Microbulbifer sp. THAF38 TaxID=2587856 RepID=UPI0015624DA5|nr:hypothetical protein [Microbulbifer sp. THAF38]